MTDTHRFSFSPSAVHYRLMDQSPLSLRYDGGPVEAWQVRLREKLRELIGMPETPRVPLHVRHCWTQAHELGSIEKIVFTSEAHADVPGYVCLPKNVKPPYRFWICLQGHSTGAHQSIAVEKDDEFTPRQINGDRDFAIGCMKHGLAALCIDQRSMGYRLEREQPWVREDSSCHDAVMHALMLGRTILGERVYDVDRAIDYLAERGDVAMDELGVMGNSGGGTVSIYAGALLERIRYMMPSCSFCTYRDSILAIPHCSCNYIPRLYQYAECADILGLFAPRPVVVVNGRTDEIFPIDAVQRAFADLQGIYAAAGAADQCRLVVGDGGHRFYADAAWPVMLAMR